MLYFPIQLFDKENVDKSWGSSCYVVNDIFSIIDSVYLIERFVTVSTTTWCSSPETRISACLFDWFWTVTPSPLIYSTIWCYLFQTNPESKKYIAVPNDISFVQDFYGEGLRWAGVVQRPSVRWGTARFHSASSIFCATRTKCSILEITESAPQR